MGDRNLTPKQFGALGEHHRVLGIVPDAVQFAVTGMPDAWLLYRSDAADDQLCGVLGGSRVCDKNTTR